MTVKEVQNDNFLSFRGTQCPEESIRKKGGDSSPSTQNDKKKRLRMTKKEAQDDKKEAQNDKKGSSR
ncbi:MAG: hypothetical protein QMD43_07350 [Thermodesulfovibrio sp.]|uniref:hypothetical protein n=1 Tax=Thermodesulfovibrio sp. 1176 TaxID=3043424 RepID=UPI0024831C37|nr:hypothetical protein [Thermodesulfovibrio sp. 1176]MDI1472643.1 hypothetical protein [Thermodesulfovibrio sp. 1176]MDI6714821.1 hypothetical protein [Thermodesulfovibrio sp.]